MSGCSDPHPSEFYSLSIQALIDSSLRDNAKLTFYKDAKALNIIGAFDSDFSSNFYRF